MLYRHVNKRTINFRMLLKVTGWLLMIEAAFMCIPTAVSLYYGEMSDFWAFSGATVLTVVTGMSMRFIKPLYTQMGRREGFLLTASVWVWFSIFGMIPFIFGGAGYCISDAFFEAMSGFTTTGATIIEDYRALGHGINLWRTLMQWIGGMGIILFTLAVIPMLNSSGGMQMFNAEVTGITHDKVRPRISSTAKALWGTYIALTLLLIGLLWLGPMDGFDSVCYSFSTISTGGFSATSRSLLDFNSEYIYIVLIIFMFLGGVNFTLIFQAVSGRPLSLWKNEVFRIYVICILAFTAILSVNNLLDGNGGQPDTWQSVILYPLFQVCSTITSTGFDSGHYPSMTSLAIFLCMLMMFTGATAGSTSGGAKLDRMTFLVKHLANEVERCVRPNAVLSVRVNGRVQSPTIVDKVTAFMCIYVILIFAGGIALSIFGLPLVDSFFNSLSCVSNAGLSAVLTGYGSTFEIIPDAGKWILSALMLIGRLEIFTVLILFTGPFWRK